MSGTLSIDICPRCGGKGTLRIYSDWKPYDQVLATCINCGFRISTVTEIATLDEVNVVREEIEFDPIEELAKPLEEWLKWGYEPVVKKEV